MPVIDSNWRKILDKDSYAVLHFVLYNKNLSYGAKCLWFAVNDLPKIKVKKKETVAHKLHTSASTVTRWLKELKKEKIIVKGKNS